MGRGPRPLLRQPAVRGGRGPRHAAASPSSTSTSRAGRPSSASTPTRSSSSCCPPSMEELERRLRTARRTRTRPSAGGCWPPARRSSEGSPSYDYIVVNDDCRARLPGAAVGRGRRALPAGEGGPRLTPAARAGLEAVRPKHRRRRLTAARSEILPSSTARPC